MPSRSISQVPVGSLGILSIGQSNMLGRLFRQARKQVIQVGLSSSYTVRSSRPAKCVS
jgi:hypothetical protein